MQPFFVPRAGFGVRFLSSYTFAKNLLPERARCSIRHSCNIAQLFEYRANSAQALFSPALYAASLHQCRGRDSNPREQIAHDILSVACLPTPPPRHAAHHSIKEALTRFAREAQAGIVPLFLNSLHSLRTLDAALSFLALGIKQETSLCRSIPDVMHESALLLVLIHFVSEAQAGIEPARRGFANPCVSTSPLGQWGIL